MKKFLSVVLILSMTLCMGIQASAGDIQEVVQTADLYHVHTGSASGGGCYTSPVYHSHTGSSSGGGGCYGSAVRHYHNGCAMVDTSVHIGSNPLETDACGCTHQTHHWYCTVCGDHWDNATNESSGCTVGHRLSDSGKWVCMHHNCGYSDGQVIRYDLNCGKSTSTVERYNLGCNASPSTKLGTFQITKIVQGSSYTLSPSLVVSSGLCVPVSYSWNTGASGDLCVTANGAYTCTVTYKDNGAQRTEVLSYTVTDYDSIPPTVSDVQKTNDRASCVVVDVTATDNIGVAGYKIELK